MGEEATRLTGYPAISIFHDFKYHPKMVIKGGDVDWIYDHLGAYAWVTEFWSPQRRAGRSGRRPVARLGLRRVPFLPHGSREPL